MKKLLLIITTMMFVSGCSILRHNVNHHILHEPKCPQPVYSTIVDSTMAVTLAVLGSLLASNVIVVKEDLQWNAEQFHVYVPSFILSTVFFVSTYTSLANMYRCSSQ